jgi:hypothetical protein
MIRSHEAKVVIVDESDIFAVFKPKPSTSCGKPCAKGCPYPCPLCMYQAAVWLLKSLNGDPGSDDVQPEGVQPHELN